jgi:hypothetical protein
MQPRRSHVPAAQPGASGAERGAGITDHDDQDIRILSKPTRWPGSARITAVPGSHAAAAKHCSTVRQVNAYARPPNDFKNRRHVVTPRAQARGHLNRHIAGSSAHFSCRIYHSLDKLIFGVRRSFITNEADEFGDHSNHQALDGICHAVHEYALGQRLLFGMQKRRLPGAHI